MPHPEVPGTVVLAPEVVERAHAFVVSVGVRNAAKRLGVSVTGLATALARLPVRRGTAVLIERAPSTSNTRAA